MGFFSLYIISLFLIMRRPIISIIFLLLSLILLLLLYAYYFIDYTAHIDFCNMADIEYPPKKVAVLLSGQLRNNYINCLWSQIINIIYPLNADVFFCFDDNVDDEEKRKIIKFLKPKKYTWSSSKNYKNIFIDKNIVLMYEKIYLCNKLKKEYEKQHSTYDIIIRLRPDLIIKEKIPLNIIKNIETNTIYYPSINKYDIFTSNSFIGMTDQIALGDSPSMDIYSDIYNFIYSNLSKIPHCPASETILTSYLKMKNLKLINYYQKFILYEKRFNYGNILSSTINLIKKYKYYPPIKCYKQNNSNQHIFGY
jgi:hypothetical protein